MTKEILLVGLGGGLGSILRFLSSRLIGAKTLGFPLATFVVNVAGCLLIGMLVGLSAKYGRLSDNLKLLLIVGFCGGFTTFSTFSNESVQLFQTGNYATLAAYVLLSVMVGFAAVWAGLSLSH